jgi:putative restriction endonuclease
MDRQDVLERFRRLKTWSEAGKRAPHKPLLVLYALGRLLAGDGRLKPFADVDAVLVDLLRAFGPARRTYHSGYPFWRLVNDGVWELTNADRVEARQSNTDAKKSELLGHGVQGGFAPDVYRVLKTDPALCLEITRELLDAHFPTSVHDDILQAVGIETDGRMVMAGRKRDTGFRERILRAYGYRCAVCGLDVRLGAIYVGLEAAHIKWHQAGGPDVEPNGLALYSLHQKFLDRGVFTLTATGQLVVSEQAIGTGGFEDWVLTFHGKSLHRPVRDAFRPKAEFASWHVREVFQGPGRHLDA